MNVFVLSTGRCGSTTFIESCQHITNFTSAHESLSGSHGDKRLAYKDNHIESDNRLSWFLGRIDEKYGDDAFYVHLTRSRTGTAKSYAKRLEPELLMNAYINGIYLRMEGDTDPVDMALDLYDTVNANIAAF